jgi:transposase-like protein
MTSAEVVAKALIEEHSDFLRESVAMIAAEIMEAEISRQIGAGKGEVAEARSTHRNGYRQRPWATRVGEIELAVPRKRSGESYFPSFLEPRKRSEKALLGVVMEAYVNGVSTRKVDHLVAELGIHMSKDQVSRICGELDEQVEAFRTRPLEGAYPYLWLDAKHLKVRDRGHVHSKALMVAFAVHESGRREVIGIEIAESETEAGWAAFLRELRARGLEGVRLAVPMTIWA